MVSSGGVTCLKCGYPLKQERGDVHQWLCTECGTMHVLEIVDAHGRRGIWWMIKRIVIALVDCRDVRLLLKSEPRDFRPFGAWGAARLLGLLIVSYFAMGFLRGLSGILIYFEQGFSSYTRRQATDTFLAELALGTALGRTIADNRELYGAYAWTIMACVILAWMAAMTAVLAWRGSGIRKNASVMLASFVFLPVALGVPTMLVHIAAAITELLGASNVPITWQHSDMRIYWRCGVVGSVTGWMSWWWLGVFEQMGGRVRALCAEAVAVVSIVLAALWLALG